ncbi:hypothetical protein D3C71_1864150 [compost metagenome]
MRLQLLPHFERQAGHGVVIDIGRDRLLFMRDLLLDFVLLAGDVPGVLHLDLNLFGQDVVRDDARTRQQGAVGVACGHQCFIGNIRTFQQVS